MADKDEGLTGIVPSGPSARRSSSSSSGLGDDDEEDEKKSSAAAPDAAKPAASSMESGLSASSSEDDEKPDEEDVVRKQSSKYGYVEQGNELWEALFYLAGFPQIVAMQQSAATPVDLFGQRGNNSAKGSFNVHGNIIESVFGLLHAAL
ncbi:hypothetical protein AK812_SmicGene16163 [Symbiodinium microadriaticum]|uniref:Uncharacterized protein n=1 Tax=Symbiodinium microadriaticum TaxID=2951 RepID=A0A1Q9E134_SYMMI|nr:hypothetical protein AK812_SmicGene16163 [Symbiodinium microadriaticum]